MSQLMHHLIPLNGFLMAATTTGRFEQAWSYVMPAWGIAWASLLLYALSLYVRRPRPQTDKDMP